LAGTTVDEQPAKVPNKIAVVQRILIKKDRLLFVMDTALNSRLLNPHFSQYVQYLTHQISQFWMIDLITGRLGLQQLAKALV
jgi:hypothetical protein